MTGPWRRNARIPSTATSTCRFLPSNRIRSTVPEKNPGWSLNISVLPTLIPTTASSPMLDVGRPGLHRQMAVGHPGRLPFLRHLADEEIGLTHEVGDERRVGMVEHLSRRSDLQYLPVPDHRDAVRHHQRLVLIVGDVHGGDAKRLRQRTQLVPQAYPQPRVQGPERLIQEKRVRPGRQRPAPTRCAAACRRSAPSGRRPPGWSAGPCPACPRGSWSSPLPSPG